MKYEPRPTPSLTAAARLVMSRLLEMSSRHLDGIVRSHYDECWRVHDECAMRIANDVIANLLASISSERDDFCVVNNQHADDMRMLKVKVARTRAENTELRAVLAELVATVKGECPSLLDEDSGGSADLALRIEHVFVEKDSGSFTNGAE